MPKLHMIKLHAQNMTTVIDLVGNTQLEGTYTNIK